MGWFSRKSPGMRIGNPASLTAAGVRVHQRDAQVMRRLLQPWQTRALSYYDMVGEIKYAANYVGHAMSLLTLIPAQIQDDGEVTPTTNQAVVDALGRIQDPGGGKGQRNGLQQQYGKLMFLTGETYLLVSNDPFTGLEQWEVLSTDELRVMDGVIMRYRAPSLMIQDYHEVKDDEFFPIDDDSAVAYRLWRRSPRWSALADSSMAGVLLLVEELILLTAVVRARARSRQAGNGILWIDDRLSQTPLEPLGDEDPLNDIFMQDLTEAMVASIEDEGSAAAVVPLIMRVPVPDNMSLKDMVYHQQLVDPVQLYPETGLREECIRRIAIGLDLPAEILTGMGDLTHWNAWQVDESTWKAHLQPMAEQLCSDLTQAYLRPFLRDSGVKDWQTYCIDYDASAIINHPDRGAAADSAYDRGTLSDDTYRKAKGFDDNDAPSQQEKNTWLGVKLRDSGLAVYGTPALKAGEELETAPGVIEVPASPAPGSAGGETTFPVRGPGGAAEAPKGKPQQPLNGEVVGSASASAAVTIAAQLAVYRARELAGAKLRSLAKKDPDALALIDGVRANLVAATLGVDRVKALTNQQPAQLVDGTRGMIEEALRSCHVTDAAMVELFVSNVELHAARTLFEERPVSLSASLTNRVAASANGKETA